MKFKELDKRKNSEVESDLIEKFVKEAGYRGQIDIDIFEIDGEYFLSEVNPRFGGGAPLSMRAGARSAEVVLKLMEGEDAGSFEVADGAIYSRFDQSVCINEGQAKVKGVIFDLDDTLYSEKEYIRSGFKAVSDYLGGGFEAKLWNYFENGKPAIDELLKEIKRTEEKETILHVYRCHKPIIHLYPGISDLINKLRKDGYKIGIITDGRPEGQRNKIEALNLKKLVDDIIITDELGGSQFRKPCDISFRIIQKRWRIPASQIVYVADNVNKDFKAVEQLGMKGILFQNKDSLYCSAETYKNNVREITDIISLI